MFSGEHVIYTTVSCASNTRKIILFYFSLQNKIKKLINHGRERTFLTNLDAEEQINNKNTNNSPTVLEVQRTQSNSRHD